MTGAQASRIMGIVAAVSPDGTVCAEHDIIYLPLTAEQVPLGSPYARELEALGCHFEEDLDNWARFT